MKKKYRVFISYYTSRQDQGLMNWLREKINLTQLFQPVVVATRTKPMVDLSQQVRDGIEGSEFFIPIITKDSLNSQWVNQEIGYAVAKERRIIPLVEKTLIDEKSLKGFIHKEKDLFVFKGVSIRISADYKKVVTEVLEALEDLVMIENWFPGHWQNFGESLMDKDVQIKNSNQYLIEGEHKFRIEDFRVEEGDEIIRFTKVGVTIADQRKLENVLRIVKKFHEYEGLENSGGKPWKISYKRSPDYPIDLSESSLSLSNLNKSGPNRNVNGRVLYTIDGLDGEFIKDENGSFRQIPDDRFSRYILGFEEKSYKKETQTRADYNRNGEGIPLPTIHLCPFFKEIQTGTIWVSYNGEYRSVPQETFVLLQRKGAKAKTIESRMELDSFVRGDTLLNTKGKFA